MLRYLTPRNINIYAFKDLGQCELEGTKIGKKKHSLKFILEIVSYTMSYCDKSIWVLVLKLLFH